MKYNKRPHEIKEDIEQIFNIEDIGTRSRKRDVVMYRYLYYKLCKLFTIATLEQMGQPIERDHTSVIHGLRKYPDLIKYFKQVETVDKWLQEKYTKEAAELIGIEQEDIEIVYCNLKRNRILTKRQLELQTN